MPLNAINLVSVHLLIHCIYSNTRQPVTCWVIISSFCGFCCHFGDVQPFHPCFLHLLCSLFFVSDPEVVHFFTPLALSLFFCASCYHSGEVHASPPLTLLLLLWRLVALTSILVSSSSSSQWHLMSSVDHVVPLSVHMTQRSWLFKTKYFIF